MAADELFILRTNFYLGNFQGCINEGESISPASQELVIERDTFIYRSHIEQGNYRLVCDDINDSAPPPLRAVKALAQYREDPEGQQERALGLVKDWLADGLSASCEGVLIVSALIYTAENNFDEALRVAVQTSTLEGRSLVVQLYLLQNRVDLAQKELKSMMSKDEDATSSQLALAWVNLYLGGEKIQEAYYIFQELCDKFAPTPLLLNGQAACDMEKGRWEEAEGTLLQALEKNPKDADTLANLACVANHLGKQDRYSRQLKGSTAPHAWKDRMSKFDGAFDRAAGRFGV